MANNAAIFRTIRVQQTHPLGSNGSLLRLAGQPHRQAVRTLPSTQGNPHFRNSNSLALYEIQHHFKLISKGDCVFDLGAGPDYNWTDLALTLAQNDDSTHKVISSDLLTVTKPRPNNLFVRGDFHEEQVRAQIGAGLGGRKFNSILVDVSPEYTGDLQADGLAINQVIFQALYFSNMFLEKGGNFVCKVLNCESTKVLEVTVHESRTMPRYSSTRQTLFAPRS